MKPSRPGLWLRKEPKHKPAVVRVYSEVRVYDRGLLPLAWTPDGDPINFEPVREDPFWECEILPDDVPYKDMRAALLAAVTDVRSRNSGG